MDQFRILYKFNKRKFIRLDDINSELVKLNSKVPTLPVLPTLETESIEDVYTYVDSFNDAIKDIFTQKNLSIIKLVPYLTGTFSKTNPCSITSVSDAIDINSYNSIMTNYFVSDSIFTHKDNLLSFEGDSKFSITLNFKYEYLLNKDEYYVVKVNGEYLASKDASIELQSKEEIVTVGTYSYKDGQGDTAFIDSITALKYIRSGKTGIEQTPVIKNKKINYIHIEEVFIGVNSGTYPMTASVKCIGLENNAEFMIKSISGYGNYSVSVNDKSVSENDIVKNNEGFIKVVYKDKEAVVDFITVEEVL